MKKKHIYIPIEILVRELNTKIIFSYEAALKDYRVYIGTKSGIDKIVQKKKEFSKSGIYFHKSQIISNRKYIKNIKRVFEKFVVLDEELGVGLSNIEYTFKKRCRNLHDIDKFFVIGKKMMLDLINFDKYFKKISSITGWLKYDIYRKKNIKLFSSEAEEIMNKYGDFYLFSSNYGALSNQGLNARMKFDKQLQEAKNSKNKQNNYITFKNAIKDFKYLKKSLFKFLKKNPKFKLILRPHPADKLYEDWNVFDQFENVKVIKKYDIVPWILASKGLIHRGCSTSMDAYFLNKPVYYFLPNRKVLNYEKNLTYKISKKIKSFENLNDVKKKIFKNDSIVNKEIYLKRPAHKIIIKELKKINITKEKKINFTLYENFKYYFFPFLGNLKLSFKKFFLGKNKIDNFKVPTFIKKKELAEKINSINNNKFKINIREVTREVFEIEKI